jgi:hypothetical protein
MEHTQVKFKVTSILRPMVCRPACIGVRHLSGARDIIFKLSLDSCEIANVGAPSDEKKCL